jgi:transposase InsO family protein
MARATPIVKMKIFAFIEQSPEPCIRDRIKSAARQTYTDDATGCTYKYTWRSISTWYYRYKNDGSLSLSTRIRGDKGKPRKVSVEELAAGITEARKHIPKQTSRKAVKTVVYYWLLDNKYFTREELSRTSFYRHIRDYELFKESECQKKRLSFAMPFANDLWQADTMHGPYVPDSKGKPRKTYLIAFIDDCSRLIIHSQFYFSEKVDDLAHAFKMGIYKRGIPRMLYFDNGSVYRSKTMIDACVRLNIKLTHTRVRDGAAKGKIERHFKSVRASFFQRHGAFKSLEHLNGLFKEWTDNYNNKIHSTIQIAPSDRYQIDIKRVRYLESCQYNDEIFYVGATRKVSKTNTFSLNNIVYECPEDLREREVEVRYDTKDKKKVFVYFKQNRAGKANIIDYKANSKFKRENGGDK